MDLKKMTEKQLKKLQSEIESEITVRSQQKKIDARQAAEAAARKHGFSLNELVGGGKGRKQKVAAKYRNPADASQTWSGRGRQPAWFKDALAKGKSPDDLLI